MINGKFDRADAGSQDNAAPTVAMNERATPLAAGGAGYGARTLVHLIRNHFKFCR